MDTPAYIEAKAKADAQGEVVRKLKADKAGKEAIDEAVNLLKKLKVECDAIYTPPKEDKPKEKPAEQGPSKKDQRKEARAAQINDAMTESFASMSSESPDFTVPAMIRSQNLTVPREYTPIGELGEALAGQTVTVRGRVHNARGKGNAGFLVLRSQLFTVQCALFAGGEAITKQVVKWAANIPRDSVVDVDALVVKTPAPVAGCTQSAVELSPTAIRVISVAEVLPFNIDDAARNTTEAAADPEALKLSVGVDLRLDNRWVDLRTPANQAIFRIQSAVGMLFREYLVQEGFIEIHSPKIIAAASESGASVFKLGYFGDQAFLAQSPQLYKQMAICADLGRVFEIGPVFRAENSNTHRHLCEFVGLDLEMEIKTHYREILAVFGKLFCHIFDGIKTRFAKELEAINAQYPFEPLVYPREPVIIPFTEGIAMLKEAKHPGSENFTDFTDIDTPAEKALGKLVKAKYNTDFYMMDRFPATVRPFYTMQCPDDERFTNSYDFYIRGEEILSGAQRIHDPAMLEKRCKELGIAGIDDYINSFRHGAVPHGGGGIGLERVVMLYLGLDNIRKTSLFPRTPTRLTP